MCLQRPGPQIQQSHLGFSLQHLSALMTPSFQTLPWTLSVFPVTFLISPPSTPSFLPWSGALHTQHFWGHVRAGDDQRPPSSLGGSRAMRLPACWTFPEGTCSDMAGPTWTLTSLDSTGSASCPCYRPPRLPATNSEPFLVHSPQFPQCFLTPAPHPPPPHSHCPVSGLGAPSWISACLQVPSHLSHPSNAPQMRIRASPPLLDTLHSCPFLTQG